LVVVVIVVVVVVVVVVVIVVVLVVVAAVVVIISCCCCDTLKLLSTSITTRVWCLSIYGVRRVLNVSYGKVSFSSITPVTKLIRAYFV